MHWMRELDGLYRRPADTAADVLCVTGSTAVCPRAGHGFAGSLAVGDLRGGFFRCNGSGCSGALGARECRHHGGRDDNRRNTTDDNPLPESGHRADPGNNDEIELSGDL